MGQRREVKEDKANIGGHTYCPSRFLKFLVKYNCVPLACINVPLVAAMCGLP